MSLTPTDNLVLKRLVEELGQDEDKTTDEVFASVGERLGLDAEHVEQIWQRRPRALPAEQEATLSLLKMDRGPYVIASLLDAHPMAQEFDLRRGTVVAQFIGNPDRFLVYPDGGLTPLGKSITAA